MHGTNTLYFSRQRRYRNLETLSIGELEWQKF